MLAQILSFANLLSHIYIYIYIYIYIHIHIHTYIHTHGALGGVVVKALRYKRVGRGFDSRWCHWNFSVT